MKIKINYNINGTIVKKIKINFSTSLKIYRLMAIKQLIHSLMAYKNENDN